MNISCVPEPASFLANTQFYSSFMHFLSSVETIVHSFGAFIIVTKTPSQMRTVKISLLYLHFCSSFLDIYVSLLMTPYILFPQIAGYSLGLLTDFGVDQAFQAVFIVVLMGLVGNSLIVIYENRFSVLLGSSHRWHHFRHIIIAIDHVVVLVAPFPIYFAMPEQVSARQEVFRRLPCLPREVYEANIVVASLEWKLLAVAAVPFGGFISSQVFVFLALSMALLNREMREMKYSATTIAMKRRFFFCVCIQTAIPLLVFLAPMILNVISVGFQIHSQGATNFAFIMISVHGLASTLAILTIHKPYRDATLQFFGKSHFQSSSSHSSVSQLRLS